MEKYYLTIPADILGKVIICIHGLDNKPAKELLTTWWRRSIKEGLVGSGKFIFNPKIKMVYWADILYDKPLDENIKDPANPYYIEEPYTERPSDFKPENHEVRKKILSFIEKHVDKIFLNEDNSINYEFIPDFIIHKYFKDLEIYYGDKHAKQNDDSKSLKHLIRKRLSEVLNQHKGDDILLIAHSMGTIVAYDVLELKLSETEINTFVTMGSPLAIPVIISKIAVEYKMKFGEKFTAKTPHTIKKKWLNFSDLQDKVAMNYNLADDYAENSNGIKPIDFIVSNDYYANGKFNPHKSFGYLRTREFSEMLFEFLMDGRGKLTVWFLNKINDLAGRYFNNRKN